MAQVKGVSTQLCGCLLYPSVGCLNCQSEVEKHSQLFEWLRHQIVQQSKHLFLIQLGVWSSWGNYSVHNDRDSVIYLMKIIYCIWITLIIIILCIILVYFKQLKEKKLALKSGSLGFEPNPCFLPALWAWEIHMVRVSLSFLSGKQSWQL